MGEPVGKFGEIKDAVKAIGMSDPMAQIGTGMASIGTKLQDGYARAKQAAKQALTPAAPARKRTTDIALPSARRRAGGRR